MALDERGKQLLAELNEYFDAAMIPRYSRTSEEDARAEAASDLWAVLSALRGPDIEGDLTLKRLTLAVRRLALPASDAWSGPSLPGTDDEAREMLQAFVNRVFVHEPYETHFHVHIRFAAEAFGIVPSALVKATEA